LITTILLGILMLYCGAKELKVPLTRFFDGKYIVLFVLENIVLTFALYRFQQLLAAWDVHYFLTLLIVAGIYGIVMLLLNGRRLIGDMKQVNKVSRK